MGGAPDPAAAQQAERVALVRGFLDAWSRHDVDAALSAFADDAVLIAARVGSPCGPQAPCTGLAGIRQQLEFAVGLNICQTLRDVYVSGSVVHGRYETRTDIDRANGVERLLRIFIADIPNDKITFFAIVNDLSDPQTAGTQAPRAPLPNPETPCAGVQ
jgi:ketosteroid isomerase-like protein